MKITKRKLNMMVKSMISEYGKDTLSKTRRGGRGEMRDPSLDFTRRKGHSDLFEDSVDDELDHLKKNIGDDIEHIRDLKDDIKADEDEERRAREARNESRRRRPRRKRVAERLSRKGLRNIMARELARMKF